MSTLKELRTRITSVKSTRKITSAMKMVAAAKLRRAQEQAEAARPYAERMERMLGSLAASLKGSDGAPPLLAGSGDDKTHLVVVASSDRGLCGGFNVNIVRSARQLITQLSAEGKNVKVLCVGRKGNDQLKREYKSHIVDTIIDVGKPRLEFTQANTIGHRISTMFAEGEFDVCTLIYAKFQSAITQEVTRMQIVPFAIPETKEEEEEEEEAKGGIPAIYEFEPDEEEILADLLPRNLSVQIYRALLENAASEQGARMTAMDNATRNASDMIDDLTIFYNRTRQGVITKELIEIISGAEAL
ncbi:MAG: F0F1 ATP synthase subunit gamma [Alphaproteobacteria bacterium]|nr:F0F1 ATP synthase subunit gamma [Alphaproteobacteria bacterium]